VVFRQKQIPKPQLLRSVLQVIDNGRVCAPSLLAFTELGVKESICWNTFFFDKLLDLHMIPEDQEMDEALLS